MRHKMVTLCPTTYEIAQKMPNFSKFCRKILMNLDMVQELEYLEKENKRLQALIDDVIDGKKRFVPGKGWIKNIYEREEE